MASRSEDSGSDIDGEILTDDEDVFSDDDDLQFSEGRRVPWIPVLTSKIILARDITVDERMVGFKGRHHMVQYMANKKAHRWGIKLWTLSESDTGYTHQIVVYKGRQPHLEKHHHVTFDNFFTSPKICHDLLDLNTYSTGTVCVRRRGMPRSYRNLKLPKGSTKVLMQGSLIAVHWSDHRAVNLFSTLALPRMENHANSRGQDNEVPQVVSVYNRTMGPKLSLFITEQWEVSILVIN